MSIDVVNHPPHYTGHPSGVECIEITRHCSFAVGNAIKYVWRCFEKGKPLEDARKAVFYLYDEFEHNREGIIDLDAQVKEKVLRVAEHEDNEYRKDFYLSLIFGVTFLTIAAANSLVDHIQKTHNGGTEHVTR